MTLVKCAALLRSQKETPIAETTLVNPVTEESPGTSFSETPPRDVFYQEECWSRTSSADGPSPTSTQWAQLDAEEEFYYQVQQVSMLCDQTLNCS